MRAAIFNRRNPRPTPLISTAVNTCTLIARLRALKDVVVNQLLGRVWRRFYSPIQE